jgi:hypothetical protein
MAQLGCANCPTIGHQWPLSTGGERSKQGGPYTRAAGALKTRSGTRYPSPSSARR